MSNLLYLNQALRFASHTSRLAVMIDSDATSVSGGDVLFLVMTCFAILGAGQLVIWIMNCPLSFGKQSQDKANTGTQEDDDEGGEGSIRVTICHKPGHLDMPTTVPEAALAGHLGHGDYLGACAGGN